MKNYKQAIIEEMYNLSRIKNSIFLGQQVKSESFYSTLDKVPYSKRLEMPVTEEMQLGMSIGMAMEGYLPISIFQRIDFLPRACDQLVNHLDIISELSKGKFNPKVIIRTTVGSNNPFDVGLQHNKDLTEGFRKLLRNVELVTLKSQEDVHREYKKAINKDISTILVEYQDMY
jgi:pyruvate/2-oxoglutarate/acetoin dehydrogenase E1 component